MADKLVNIGSHNQRGLTGCNPPGMPEPLFNEPPTKSCEPVGDTLRDEMLDSSTNRMSGFGKSGLCDPMQTGQIVADANNPNPNVIYRYSKAFRGCDEAVTDLFRNVVVIDNDGKAHPVPIIWGSQERAVGMILQDNIRKDNSLVVNRVKLPLMSIVSRTFQMNTSRYLYHKAVDYLGYLRPDGKPGATVSEKYERDTVFGFAKGIPMDIGYTLYAWTAYQEDMMQVLEQLTTKFSPIAYINVRGVPWETAVRLESIANNLELEPGDSDRIIKFEFNLMAETYIPQPIVRHKSVLKTRTTLVNNLNPDEITEVVGRLEDAVEELR